MANLIRGLRLFRSLSDEMILDDNSSTDIIIFILI
jgi:hypothetical protein